MDEADVDIDSLAENGDGMTAIAGRRVRVPFAIPGERVRVRLDRLRRGDPTATLVAVLRPSPHRVLPRCQHFGPDPRAGTGTCGGCAWQHIAYPEQLRLKTALVDRLVRAAVRAPAARPMLPATALEAPWGYRQKVHFVFGTVRAGRRVRAVMGHYARGSRHVIPIDECPVHDERGNHLAFELGDRYTRAGLGAADDSQGGTLRGLAVRVGHGTGELMATIVVSDAGDKRLRTATRAVMAARSDTAFHLNVHPRDDGYIFGRDTRTLQGADRLRESVGTVSYLVSPTAFFQTNVAAAELLVNLVVAAVPAGSRVLDLYAGAGLFALPLALAGHTVTAIEENRAAVADGIASARLNRIDERRCRFIARPAEDAVLAAPPADVVVLDPPREGCDPSVLDAVFRGIRPRTGIYVSCSPEALATDLAHIVACGYRVDSMQPVDMFPHTPHIETVVVVSR